MPYVPLMGITAIELFSKVINGLQGSRVALKSNDLPRRQVVLCFKATQSWPVNLTVSEPIRAPLIVSAAADYDGESLAAGDRQTHPHWRNLPRLGFDREQRNCVEGNGWEGRVHTTRLELRRRKVAACFLVYACSPLFTGLRNFLWNQLYNLKS